MPPDPQDAHRPAGAQERDRRDDAAAQPAVTGVGGAAGRDQYVGSQIGQATRAAQAQPATSFNGDLFRAVDAAHASSFSDHSFSGPGRYNLPGQSALYTAPTLQAVQAETANYKGLDGKAVVRSTFQGELLDLRATPGVPASALTQGHGDGGRMRGALARITGEDAYTLPRAMADVARERQLSGVIAPANKASTNVALFPDDPNVAAAGPGRIQSGLRGQDYTSFQSNTPVAKVTFSQPHLNVADTKPNRLAPAAVDATGAMLGPEPYNRAAALDASALRGEAHGRAGGARYGLVGGAAASVVDGLVSGRPIEGRKVAEDAGLGAASAHAETVLARNADRLLRPAAIPPGVAGSATAGVEANGAAALRPPSLAAGAGAAGVVGGVVSGGVTAWHDADAVKSGRMSAGRATADVAVQAGVGFGSGAAGAAAGAAVGSVVPVAGTAVGAGVGFGVGMGTAWAAQHSDAVHAVQKQAGDYLTKNFEAPLQKGWHAVSNGVDSVRSMASQGASEAQQLASSGSAMAQHAIDRARGMFGGAAAAEPAAHQPAAHQPAAPAAAGAGAAGREGMQLWMASAATPPAHGAAHAGQQAQAAEHAAWGRATGTAAPEQQPAQAARSTVGLRR